jgi:hypothetical protein
MDRVYHAQQRPFNHIRDAGIALREVNPQQRHIGVLYRDSASNDVLFLHLAWHFDLKCNPPNETYLWIDPAIHPRRLIQVAAVCRMVWRANGRNTIPYGFCPPSDCFDATTGEYLFGPTQYGLTCATFVLAIFHRAGIVLVHYETWPVNRPGDAEWQTSIVDALRNTSTATPEHIRAVQSDVGATVRYRPEEVAGAAIVVPMPASFQAVEERSREILIRLRNPQASLSQRNLLQSLCQRIGDFWRRIVRKIQRH